MIVNLNIKLFSIELCISTDGISTGALVIPVPRDFPKIFTEDPTNI